MKQLHFRTVRNANQKPRPLATTVRWLLTFCTSLFILQASAVVRRVDGSVTSTTGNGSSWANAYKYLQNAITASSSGDEIWIKAGTYKTQTASAFVMKNGVKIYGGFDGAENNLSERDFTANKVILKRYSASYPVIDNNAVNSAAILDGVTLDGEDLAAPPSATYSSAGIDNSGGSFPTLSNIEFRNLNGTSGGALYANGGTSAITNVLFYNNSSTGAGGAVFIITANPTFNKVVFENNNSGSNSSGGAIAVYESVAAFTNVIFYNNSSGGGGGAVLNYNANSLTTKIPSYTNCLFISNRSSSFGGAISNTTSQPSFVNCTFVRNFTSLNVGNGAGGGIYYVFTSNSSNTSTPTSNVTNCIFSGNGYSTNGSTLISADDINYSQYYTPLVNYSSFVQAGSFPNANNTPSIGVPFQNIDNPKGADGNWFTADDGLQLSFCSVTAIDKGNNGATSIANDILGQPRKFDVGLVPDGGAGTAPIIDMGAYESQNTTTEANIAGSIGNAHTVPYPKELTTDNITSVTNAVTGSTYSWQMQTIGNTNWVTATGSTNSATYSIPNISQTTTYRRIATSSTYCNTPYYTSPVQITVVQPDGVIEGTVTSASGAPVQGITITATRLTAVAGSAPASYNYPSVVTGPDGTYTINNIYYGTGSGASANVRITPSKAGHNFNFPYLDRTLTPNTSSRSGVDFIDNTVISIVGTTYQQCTTCTNATTGATETQTCPIDSILIHKGPLNTAPTYATTTGYISPSYGRYALTVTDPSPLVIEPRFTGHTFSPARDTVTPTNNLSGIDFADVTTRTITGKITDGCNGYIGVAVLEFADVLPNGPNNTVRSSCFRKRVTTAAGTGAYSITLPARKYKVRVVTFTSSVASSNPGYISQTDLFNFFASNRFPQDSLIADITNSNDVLNLVYVRPPFIAVTDRLNLLCNNQYALIKQAAADSFKLTVYQGPASLNCPITDTGTINIQTNVNQDGSVSLALPSVPVSSTGSLVRLVGGTPNITGDHLKDIFATFTDKYGRAGTTFNRRVLVTGVKADVATFTTVSPEIPLVVLHDPPGDGSSSTWQQSNSITNALRLYTASSQSTEGWIQAKIGAKFQIGFIVSTENSVWGTVKGKIGVASASTSSDEAILTTTATNTFSTANNSSVIGTTGDVYIGAALNLKYAASTVIGYNNCTITSERKLIVANDGFATEYMYSEDHILNTLIPSLRDLATSDPARASRYLDQIKVWQQVVDNNNENKRRAAFVVNKSFDGGSGAYTNTITTTATKTSTIEFKAEVNSGIAAELGFEIAGSGLSGGVDVNFKMESGNSESNTTTQETTISYTLEDDDQGDNFSVNVKKDPVYNTPVFELAAGRASCPAEPGAQPRDEVYFVAVNPVVRNVPGTDYANFTLKIVNTSQSHETRTYRLAYDQGSNIANESVRIAGTDYTGIPVTLSPLAYGDSATVVVSIKRLPGSSVYAYEGERFRVLDNCVAIDSREATSLQVSAYYVSPCSNIAITQPENGWLLNSFGNNQIFIQPSGYDLATLSSVNVQYATGLGTNWADGPFLSNAQLASGFNLDASTLPEGTVNVRLRLDCNDGTTYSLRSTGFIDRIAPQLSGTADPTDDNYVNGDVIGFGYNEALNTDSVQVTVRRLSNNQLLPATASVSGNKIIVTPASSITAFVGDSIRVIISGIRDVYGNVRTKADTTRFIIGTTVAGTGNQALTVSLTNPTVYKNGDSSINVFFTLPASAANETRVNYSIGGTARYGIDYTVVYSGSTASYESFNGSAGSIRIANGANQAVLKIKPIGGDTSYSPNKTVIISLTEGGDYLLGATTSATGAITSEDGITIYTFTGDGAWNIKNNWLNGKMPLSQLIAPKEIIVNPSGTAVLNVPQTIRPGAKVTVKQNRRFIIQGNLKVN